MTETAVVPSTDARKKVISGKRFISHKKFVRKYNKKLKAKNKPLIKLRKPKPEIEKIKTRFPRNYVVQQGKSRLKTKKKCYADHVRHLRSSIKPGTILILLAGPHKGKRVIFLKALASGLLLVTGPFKFNGVPLRRVNQRYVIATCTQVDITQITFPERLDDVYFKRVDLKDKSDADKLFNTESKKYTVNEERKEDQKKVDKDVISAIKRQPESRMLHKYLRSLFSLGKRDYPHLMVF